MFELDVRTAIGRNNANVVHHFVANRHISRRLHDLEAIAVDHGKNRPGHAARDAAVIVAPIYPGGGNRSRAAVSSWRPAWPALRESAQESGHPADPQSAKSDAMAGARTRPSVPEPARHPRLGRMRLAGCRRGLALLLRLQLPRLRANDWGGHHACRYPRTPPTAGHSSARAFNSSSVSVARVPKFLGRSNGTPQVSSLVQVP